MDGEPTPPWFEEMQRERREHESRLTVGTRVSVDIGECPYFLTWHGWIEQNVTGRIMATDIDRFNHQPPGHTYIVWFDWPIRKRSMWCYAAHELILIPERTPEEIVQETLARLD